MEPLQLSDRRIFKVHSLSLSGVRCTEQQNLFIPSSHLRGLQETNDGGGGGGRHKEEGWHLGHKTVNRGYVEDLDPLHDG